MLQNYALRLCVLNLCNGDLRPSLKCFKIMLWGCALRPVGGVGGAINYSLCRYIEARHPTISACMSPQFCTVAICANDRLTNNHTMKACNNNMPSLKIRAWRPWYWLSRPRAAIRENIFKTEQKPSRNMSKKEIKSHLERRTEKVEKKVQKRAPNRLPKLAKTDQKNWIKWS